MKNPTYLNWNDLKFMEYPQQKGVVLNERKYILTYFITEFGKKPVVRMQCGVSNEISHIYDKYLFNDMLLIEIPLKEIL